MTNLVIFKTHKDILVKLYVTGTSSIVKEILNPLPKIPFEQT